MPTVGKKSIERPSDTNRKMVIIDTFKSDHIKKGGSTEDMPLSQIPKQHQKYNLCVIMKLVLFPCDW